MKRTLPLLFGLVLAACAADSKEAAEDLDEGAFTSASARLLDFTFDGEVKTDGDPREAIKYQLHFSIGQLNGEVGVGRLDKLAISNLRPGARDANGLQSVKYRATLPVSLSKRAQVRRSYTLKMPLRVDPAGQQEFFDTYSATCSDPFAHDNEPGIFWYYYRPNQEGCAPAPTHVSSMRATVRVSRENSENKYPEYDKIWSDGALDVIAIFGKVTDGTTTESDRGIWSHNHFVSTMRQTLPGARVTPENVPDRAGVAFPDVTVEGTLADGKKVRVTSFLVDNVREGGEAFERRYNELSGDADVIVYNGHAGLGQNVRALANMGKFKAGKYQIVYMNGCDTFAYVDGSLAQTRARLNPSDPTGTKFMEIITNSMPPNWDSLPNNTISLVGDLQRHDAPRSYLEILGKFDQSGFVVVTGDEDNQYRPN